MQTSEFIARVERDGPALGPDVARNATFATLEALCEHLPAEETRRMASQLPKELAKPAQEGGDRAEASYRPIPLAEFYEKVAIRAELPHDDATGYARAVTRTLKEALTSGETTDVTFELPPELTELLA